MVLSGVISVIQADRSLNQGKCLQCSLSVSCHVSICRRFRSCHPTLLCAPRNQSPSAVASPFCSGSQVTDWDRVGTGALQSWRGLCLIQQLRTRAKPFPRVSASVTKPGLWLTLDFCFCLQSARTPPPLETCACMHTCTYSCKRK